MAAVAFTKKTPYLDTEDTLEEVGISRRQLNYWREKELFKPEFGSDAKKFTEKDIKILKFARQLIVEQQFPVDVAKRLIDAVNTADSWWEGFDLEDFQYLDVKSGDLLPKVGLDQKLWAEFGGTAKEGQVESRLYSLTVLLFRLLRSRLRSPGAYKERRDQIFQELRGLESAARLTYVAAQGKSEAYFELQPELEDDPAILKHSKEWLKSANSRLSEFKRAADDIQAYESRGGEWGRFYSTEAIDTANEKRSLEEIPWDEGEPPF
jgi:DNA-binding transcriptional MerR regulator